MISVVKGGSGVGNWNLLFRRIRYDGEIQQLEDLQQRLHAVTLDHSKRDLLKWRWASDGCFSVKSVYNKWEQSGNARNLVLETIWKNLSPPKVEIFAWMALQDRVPTRSVLQSRNLILDGNSALCPLCSMHLETPQHLFLHCKFSWNVWSLILDWWHVRWVCPQSLEALFTWWFDNRFRNLENHLWETTFFAIIWSLWLARNDYVFNNASTGVGQVGEVIKTRVAMWIKVKFDIKVYTVEDFKGFLDGVRKVKL